MTWKQVETEWDQRRFDAKEQWAELTDRDLDFIAGHRDRLLRTLRRRYGLALDQAEKRVEWWLRNLETVAHRHHGVGSV